MSLDKAIEHGKEKRKPYHGSKAIDGTCRNHGSCDWCRDNRKHKFRDRNPPDGDLDDLVRRGDVIAALHAGNIDCGLVESETYKKLRELSKKIDAEIMRVPMAERCKNVYVCESHVKMLGGVEAVMSRLDNGYCLVVVPDDVNTEEV